MSPSIKRPFTRKHCVGVVRWRPSGQKYSEALALAVDARSRRQNSFQSPPFESDATFREAGSLVGRARRARGRYYVHRAQLIQGTYLRKPPAGGGVHTYLRKPLAGSSVHTYWRKLPAGCGGGVVFTLT